MRKTMSFCGWTSVASQTSFSLSFRTGWPSFWTGLPILSNKTPHSVRAPHASPLQQRDHLPLPRSRYRGLVLPAKHIHLGAHAKCLEVHARLDGESRAGDDPPIVVGFVIVHVHTVTVDVLAETVAGAVKDPFAVSSLLDHLPGRAIDFPSADVASSAGRILDQLDRGIPPLCNRAECTCRFRRDA